MTTRETIDAFLGNPAIAVVGVSRTQHKFGNMACRVLREKGYRIYQVHRRAATIDGQPCYATLADLPEKVNAVLIVVPPWEAIDVIGEAAAAGIHYVWLQQGAESPEAANLAAERKLALIAGECILMYAKPTGIHRMHQLVRRVMGVTPI
jgi:predicted CoA-binding protein